MMELDRQREIEHKNKIERIERDRVARDQERSLQEEFELNRKREFERREREKREKLEQEYRRKEEKREREKREKFEQEYKQNADKNLEDRCVQLRQVNLEAKRMQKEANISHVRRIEIERELARKRELDARRKTLAKDWDNRMYVSSSRSAPSNCQDGFQRSFDRRGFRSLPFSLRTPQGKNCLSSSR